MEITQPIRDIVERSYAVDPVATLKDLQILASSELDIAWALLGKELESYSKVQIKRRIPPGVTKVRARRTNE